MAGVHCGAGGMPYLVNLRYEDAPGRQYLTDLFYSVQLKDIVKRNKVRDVDLLERILAYVRANVGTTFSASSLDEFDMSRNGIKHRNIREFFRCRRGTDRKQS